MFKSKIITLAAVFAALGTGAFAEGWKLNAEASHIAFGSVKSDEFGEVHSFKKVDGKVTNDGLVKINIDLASVETLIDIRNERMVEHVFRNTPKATIAAEVDMEEISALSPGQSVVTEASGVLSLVGTDIDLDAELFVIRLSEDRVMVSSNDMIMLSTEDAGLTAGIDKLMELASLPSITRVSPVTMRLVFDGS